MKQLLEAQLSELKTMAFEDLARLPRYYDERLKLGRKTVTVSVWKDEMPDHEIRVVVQVYRYLWLGIARMEVGGFATNPDGPTRELDNSELYEFA